MPLGSVAHRCYTFVGGRRNANPKKRINITVDDKIYEALERLSSERDQSVAGVAGLA